MNRISASAKAVVNARIEGQDVVVQFRGPTSIAKMLRFLEHTLRLDGDGTTIATEPEVASHRIPAEDAREFLLMLAGVSFTQDQIAAGCVVKLARVLAFVGVGAATLGDAGRALHHNIGLCIRVADSIRQGHNCADWERSAQPVSFVFFGEEVKIMPVEKSEDALAHVPYSSIEARIDTYIQKICVANKASVAKFFNAIGHPDISHDKLCDAAFRLVRDDPDAAAGKLKLFASSLPMVGAATIMERVLNTGGALTQVLEDPVGAAGKLKLFASSLPVVDAATIMERVLNTNGALTHVLKDPVGAAGKLMVLAKKMSDHGLNPAAAVVRVLSTNGFLSAFLTERDGADDDVVQHMYGEYKIAESKAHDRLRALSVADRKYVLEATSGTRDELDGAIHKIFKNLLHVRMYVCMYVCVRVCMCICESWGWGGSYMYLSIYCAHFLFCFCIQCATGGARVPKQPTTVRQDRGQENVTQDRGQENVTQGVGEKKT